MTVLAANIALMGLAAELSGTSRRLSAGTMFYDFIGHASEASWASGAGALPFPGSGTDSRGFARYVDNAVLEDGSKWGRVLETHPQWIGNGFIEGRYPKQTVPANAQLRVNLGFLNGATGTDGATFEVHFYETYDQKEKRHTILSHRATYDNKLDLIIKDLGFLAGKTGWFLLYVNAGQSSGQDWAVWAEARIETLLPDLVVTEMSWTPKEPRVGEEAEATIVVSNIGDGPATSCRGALLVDGEPVSSVPVPSLLPDETQTVKSTWTPSAEGEQELAFYVDYWQSVEESKEDNNEKREKINVLPSLGKPDLLVTGITWLPEATIITVGHTFSLKPLVQNDGKSESGSCVGEFTVNGAKIGSVEIPSIPAGKHLWQITEVSVSWTPTAEGEYVIRFVADVDDVVDELDELNNAVEVTVTVGARDDTPPTVGITHYPPTPTERDTVTFRATATDPSGIGYIQILVNGELKEHREDVTSCEYTGGPYPRRSTVTYAAQASDKAGNVYTTPWRTFTVAPHYTEPLTIELTIEPAEPTEVDEVTLTATASYPYGIRQLRIYVQGTAIDYDIPPPEAIPADQTTRSTVRGPWAPDTTVRYWADTYDVDGHYARTPERSFTVSPLRRENVKNMTNYWDREIFVISDLDWRAVLSLVPIAIWREPDGTLNKFPALIYHEENRTAFDADSSIRFIQQYAYGRQKPAIRVTILGQPPDELIRLMVAPPPLGPSLEESQIRVWRSRSASLTDCHIALTQIPRAGFGDLQRALETKWDLHITIPEGGGTGIVPMDDIFTAEEERQLRSDYWSTLNTYVVCEDEYTTGLMASVFASHINAPILFQGQYDLAELNHKSIYLVGSFTDEETRTLEEGNVRILQRFTLDQLRRHYVLLTRTNKVILVNPLDLWLNHKQNYRTDKTSTVSYLFGKHSLAAPFLAAAKQEVIISTPSHSYPEIDTYVKQNMESLPLAAGLKYLTIVASPEAIPIARPNFGYPVAIRRDRIYYQGFGYGDIDIVENNLQGTHEEYVVLSGGAQFSPACSEDLLVWVDESTYHDIWYRDLSTGTDHQLTSQWVTQTQPAVYATKIVWQDCRHLQIDGSHNDLPGTGHQYEIYVHDARTGTTRRLTYSNASQERPAIWDRFVVWQDNRNGNCDIYKYDLDSGEEERVTSDPTDQAWPSISWNKIVYSDLRNGNWDIYMCWLGVGGRGVAGERRITTDTADQMYPRIYGDRIVWQDNRNGNWDIYMYDLDTDTEQQITYEPIDQVLPIIYEDKVAWYERSEEGWWYVCLYDASTGSRTTIARTEVSADDGASWLEVDGRYYGSTQNLAHQDIATGRIYGITAADASAYIARDLFFTRIQPNNDALVVVREDHQTGINNPIGEVDLENYARTQYWTASIERKFRQVQFYSGYDEVARNQNSIHDLYDDRCLLIYADHGGTRCFEDMMYSEYLCQNQVSLKPATILDLACLTGAYNVEGDKTMVFAAQNIRRGAMVYMGATDRSYWHTMFDDILNGVFIDGKTIGQAYMEARNEDYDEEHWNFSLTLKGDIFYVLYGDPAFEPMYPGWAT